MVKGKDLQPRLGSVMQKALLLLGTGFALGLSGRPDTYFRILRGLSKEWKAIHKRQLHLAIKNLYRSQLIDCKENNDGTTSLIVTNNGRQKVFRYNLDTMEIKRSRKWDGLWRAGIFYIPESHKTARDALASKLKQLGFCALQKSVFIFPLECRDEINFIVELFQVRPYVRFLLVKEIDVDLDLRKRFRVII